MSNLQSIEVTAPEIEAAIEKGIAELGVSRDAVMVEVLEEPSRRLLGLGSKLAKVRLTVIRAPAAPPPSATMSSTPAADENIILPSDLPAERQPRPSKPEKSERAEPANRPARSDKADASQGGAQRSSKPRTTTPRRPDGVANSGGGRGPAARSDRPAPSRAPRPVRDERPADDDEGFDAELPAIIYDDEDDYVALPSVATPADLVEEVNVGTEVLRQLLVGMDIQAEIGSRPSMTDGNEAQHWTLEILGKDLGVLIGRRGETLVALQYLTRLLTSRKIGHRANLVIDVEGYKSRREAMLQRLAQRMAEQAVQRGRTVSMEPMPPHERRIIHLTLRNHPDVVTESVGEGDRRKVTVIPKKQKQP